MTTNTTERAGDFYAAAAKSRSSSPGCCPAGAPALAPDYDADALATVPAEAVGASFGCGDPLAFSRLKPGETVLDLGCGAGLDLILAAERVGPNGRVIGVDASADMLALAAANIEKAGLSARIELRPGVIEALPAADGSIDWVVSNCVVNLSPDKAQVFREIARVLKPGGEAVIADLVAEGLPDWVHAHNDLHSACISGAVSEGDYLRLAREAGLRVEVIDRMAYDAGMVRALISDALPVATDAIARRLGMEQDAFIEWAAGELAGRIISIKLRLIRA